MYKALESFATNDYDVKRSQILEDNFTSQEEIDEYLEIGYIEVYDGSIEITENGTYNVEDYETADVNVSAEEPSLGTKTITENGIYTASSDDLDGYSSVEVNVSSGGGFNVTVDVSEADKKTSRSNNNGVIRYFITNINSLNTTGLKNFKYFFEGLDKVTTLPAFDTSSATDVTGMFYGCNKLTTLPTVDISKCTSLKEFANGCAELTELPNFNTSNITDFTMAFFYTRKIITAPAYDLSNATKIGSMFANSNVVNVPVYNLAKITDLSYWFSWCSQLTDESLNNIMASLLTATSYTGTKTLQYIFSNQSTVINKCTTLSNWAALEAAGWSTGL